MNLLNEYTRRFPPLIDSTMRSDFSACERKFFYRHILGLTHEQVSVHLIAGAAYAKGLEVSRRAYYSGESDLETAILLGVEALLIEYGDPNVAEDSPKSWDRTVLAFLSYHDNWPMDQDYIKPMNSDIHEPRVEFSFALEIQNRVSGGASPPSQVIEHPDLYTNDPLLYGGKFDMLAERNGVLFVHDDKTASQLGASWSKQWELRSQFTGYVWGAQSFGYPVAGAIIRGTSFLKTTFGHAEAIVYRSSDMTQRWLDRLSYDVMRMKTCYVRDEFHTTGEESGACSSYGGCPYLQLCKVSNPEAWIEPEFHVEYWTPISGELV